METFARTSVGIFAAVVIAIVIVVAGSGLASLPAIRRGASTTSSITSPDGIQLNLALSSTTLLLGQKLNVTVSIVNILPKINVIKTSDDWQFLGVPVALWPPCYFGLPAQIVILRGTYGLPQLEKTANVHFDYACFESVAVDHLVFQPTSDQVNLTGNYNGGVTVNGTWGPFNLTKSFTTGGYWNLTSLAGELNIPIIGDGADPNIPPDSIPFAPGEYTAAVADEWGQVAVLHFTVYPNVSSRGSFIYLTNDCYATGAGGYTPCFGGDHPYVFNCIAAASTPQGCTQTVTSTLAPYPSYVINIRYPFANSSAPSWANCLWITSGAVGATSGNGLCFSVNSTSFVVGQSSPPPP